MVHAVPKRQRDKKINNLKYTEILYVKHALTEEQSETTLVPPGGQDEIGVCIRKRLIVDNLELFMYLGSSDTMKSSYQMSNVRYLS